MSHSSHSLALIFLAFILGGCATTAIAPYPEADPDRSRAKVFEDRWQTYLASLDALQLQPDCRPRLVEPPASVAYRGTVVLLHGYSACPQQFFELAERLGLAGYRSVLPLLPGHGLQFADADKDDFSDLPVGSNWRKAYDQFALQVNGLMEYADGQRVIGGLSVGGAASLYINAQARDLYDRNIVFSPFFAPGGGALAGSAAAVTARTPALRSASVKPFGLKQPCLDKREQGRAGFCNYQLKHVGALTAMGSELRKILLDRPLDLPLQFVAVEDDFVVDNSKTREILAAQQATGSTSACFMPAGVPHAMISRYDSPDVDMYWRDAVYSGAIGFITAGETFPTNNQISEIEAPYRQCQLDLTGDD